MHAGPTSFKASHESLIFDAVSLQEMSVDGKLGDVIQVSLTPLSLKNFRFDHSQIHQSLAYPDGHQFPANDLGYMAHIDNWESPLRTSGVFYYTPVVTGTSQLLLAADDRATDQLTCLAVRLDVGKGFSTSGENEVTFGEDKLSIYRQQQRLHYLNYPAEDCRRYTGQCTESCMTVPVDGIKGPTTKWAIGVFNSSILANGLLVTSTLQFVPEAEAFMNVANAPRWVESNPVQVSLLRRRRRSVGAPVGHGIYWRRREQRIPGRRLI